MKDWEQEITDRFLRLFDGNQSHHIQTVETGGTNAKGKANSKTKTVHEAVEAGDLLKHLKGVGPAIGIAPNRDDNTCMFGVLDFDIYGMSDEDVFKVPKHMRVPSLACRTKSQGLHVYVFVDEPVSSRMMHEFLKSRRRNMPKSWRKHIEIFPMASQLELGEGDNAKCVNMPLNNAKRPPVWCIKEDGEGVTLDTQDNDEILKVVEEHCIIDAAVVKEIADAAPDIDESDLGYRVPKEAEGRDDCLMKISRAMQTRGV